MEIKRLVKDCMKRIFAVSFCIVFIFLASYKKPVKAKAAATACTIAGCVLLATAITALGIGVSAHMNNESYTNALNNAWNDLSDNVKQQATIISAGADYVRYEVTKDFLIQGLNAVRKYYPDMTFNNGALRDFVNEFNLSEAVYYSFNRSGTLQDFSNFKLISTFTVPSTNVAGTIVQTNLGPFTLSLEYESGVYFDGNRWADAWVKQAVTCDYMNSHHGSGIGTNDYFKSGELYKVLSCNKGSNSALMVLPDASVITGSGIVIGNIGTSSIPFDTVYNPANKDLYAQGQSALNHTVNDIADKLTGAQGGTAGKVHVRVDTNGRVGTIDKINDDIKSKTQEQVTETSIADATTEAENDRTNTDRDKTVPTPPKAPALTIPELITRKFPFCLPFDFVAAVKTIQAPKKPPVFVVPLLKVPKWGWDYSITLDWEKFDSDGKLSAIVRWALSILWSIGLIFVTKKLIWK